jgi:hypothetical protein
MEMLTHTKSSRTQIPTYFFIFEVKLSDNVGFRHQIRRQNRILTDFILYIPLIINPCFYYYLCFVLPL